ncbi:MAG: DNA starvation/stationary phase protection protein [Caulobacterales bacterium]|nr:DNA starvation/stationary phase protection protein [Caulobacterales bacterium]
MNVEIGIPKEDREQIADGLARVLADTYTLYFKTHAFHWNVTGPHFPQLHALFEEQYRDLWNAADVIAERMRALGVHAPVSGERLSELASITEASETPGSQGMIAELASGHERLVRTIRAAFKAAEAGDDQATMDAYVARLAASEKAAWMLRAMLG